MAFELHTSKTEQKNPKTKQVVLTEGKTTNSEALEVLYCHFKVSSQ